MRSQSVVLLLAALTFGCSGTPENSLANAVADPTGQLPPHVAWNSYNVYSFSAGGWTKVISLGNVTGTLPTLGAHPALITHGLGGSFRTTNLVPLAQYLSDNNLATSIVGFEYDSQQGISDNGTYLAQAVTQLEQGATTFPAWELIGHSMGGVVIRSALEFNTFPIASTGNAIITLGTPHLGSPVCNALQSTTALAIQAAAITVLDQNGGFTNADGNPCQVDLNGPGFSDLRTDSPVLANLNAEVESNRSEVQFYTIAGDSTGDYAAIDIALGVSTDDGLVTIPSANYDGLAAAAQDLAPVDHTQLPSDSVTVFPLIRQYLTP